METAFGTMQRKHRRRESWEIPMNEHDALRIFEDRLRSEWLVAYCHDPSRGYDVAGYRDDSNKVTLVDAKDFLWAMDHHLLEDHGGGRYRLPKSGADVVLFWEGHKTKSPRRITLSMEPIIAIASVARLHRDFGWPIRCLGMEPARWEFDIAAFLSESSATEYIAGEVKKSVRELNVLLDHLQAMSSAPDTAPTKGRTNARKKWEGLRRSRASLFWAVGPGGVSHLFEVSYGAQYPVGLREVSIERLACPVPT